MSCWWWRGEQVGGGRAGELRDSWCTLGGQDIPLRQRLLNWIMSSEAKWSHVTLKDMKRSIDIFMLQWEKVLKYHQHGLWCKNQEGNKRWFIAVSLLSPSNTKHPHNYSKTITHRGVSTIICALCQYCSRNVFFSFFQLLPQGSKHNTCACIWCATDITKWVRSSAGIIQLGCPDGFNYIFFSVSPSKHSPLSQSVCNNSTIIHNFIISISAVPRKRKIDVQTLLTKQLCLGGIFA